MSKKDEEISEIMMRINKLDNIPEDRDKWEEQAENIIKKIKANPENTSPKTYYELGRYVYGTIIRTLHGEMFITGSHDFNMTLSLCERKVISKDILNKFYFKKWLPLAERFVKNKGMILPRIVPCIALKHNNKTEIYECALVEPDMLGREKYIYVQMLKKLPSESSYMKMVEITLPKASKERKEEIVKKDMEAWKYVIENEESLRNMEDVYVGE